MLFAHDTEVALRGAAALVNTAATLPTDTEDLATVADLDEFVRDWEWTGAHSGEPAELEAVKELRPRLRRLWTADTDDAVALVNELLAEAGALPQLVRHGEWSWHLHATPPEAPLATRMAVEAAMAMVDVIRADELARLRVCAADDCEDVVVDLSKNRSKRFCDGGCGNRANVAAYRARQRQR
ncbi:CGNR zinc finger domain-containing protein [Phycicoccus sp. Soil803]|uniref:CGNR zinc finger domain-containing protein n=1 Tax=Phycicoccus sp. Soil803 TaxID=1736415 RepID=UPI000709CF77|nr:CGNR zinc finger domain-containing protein [Phycicoccus sp. Soil803]KRF23889.1 RNA-binding protein [Phycicoccus sp. Soil803]